MGLKRKILVIDDDQSVCDMIALTLKSRDHEVFTETRYKEGVERAGEILPDLAFISLLLDSTNGLKVSKAIHAIDKLGKLPVVMLISYKGELDPKYTVTIGIVDVLVKPLTEKDIILKTEAILGPDNSQNAAAERTISELPDFGKAGEGFGPEEEYAGDSGEKTEESEPHYEPSDIQQTFEDGMGQTQLSMHETEKAQSGLEETGQEAGDGTASEKGFSPIGDGIAEETDNEEKASEAMNEDDQDKGEPLEAQRDADDGPIAETEKRGPGKKILMLAAALALIAAIGTGTYLGLQFFFSGKGGSAAIPSARRTAVKGSNDYQQKKTESAPAEEIPQSALVQEKEPAVATDEQNVKKAERPAAPAVSQGKAAVPAQKKSRAVKGAKVVEPRAEGPVSLQIGFFADQKNAEALVKNLKQKGYRALIKNEAKGAGGMSYRGLVGKFNSSKEALEYAESILRKQGIKPLLYKE